MKEKTYTVYIVFDGKEFPSKERCIEYEKQEMISRVSAAQKLCEEIECKNCPYYIPNYCKFSGQPLFYYGI